MLAFRHRRGLQASSDTVPRRFTFHGHKRRLVILLVCTTVLTVLALGMYETTTYPTGPTGAVGQGMLRRIKARSFLGKIVLVDVPTGNI